MPSHGAIHHAPQSLDLFKDIEETDMQIFRKDFVQGGRIYELDSKLTKSEKKLKIFLSKFLENSYPQPALRVTA